MARNHGRGSAVNPPLIARADADVVDVVDVVEKAAKPEAPAEPN